jgi:ketosteroid isomerase-like protein
MLTDIEQALNDKQVQPILELLEDDAVVIFLNGHVARGPDGVSAYFEDMFSGSTAVLKDYQTRADVGAPARFYGDIAVADGTTEDSFFFIDGSDMTVTTYWSAVLTRSGDGWKIANLHFSSNLFDNPLMSAFESKMMFLIGASFLIGALIVFLLMRKKATH